MFLKGAPMVRRRIAFIRRQIVLRKYFVPGVHACVAVDFGEDRGGRDGSAAGVSVNEGLLLDGEIEFEGIDQEIVGFQRESFNSPAHS